MAITKSELYFEIDEDNEENKKHDPKVNKSGGIYVFLCHIITGGISVFYVMC